MTLTAPSMDPREVVSIAERVNKDALAEHLRSCNSETNKLLDKVKQQQEALIEVSEERDLAREQNRALKIQQRNFEKYVVEIVVIGYRRTFVTLAMILSNPGLFVHHDRCEREGCQELACTGHDEGRG